MLAFYYLCGPVHSYVLRAELTGQANVKRWTPTLLDLLRNGDPLDAAHLVTTEAPLARAPEMYEQFKKKEPGVIKVALRP